MVNFDKFSGHSRNLICEVCGKEFKEHPPSSPLHLTNWNLLGHKTLNVCSEECKQWAIDSEVLELRKRQLKNTAAEIKVIQKVADILGLYEKIDGMYRAPKDFQRAKALLESIEYILDEDEDMNYED